ncbi:unnamed protein product [Lepidochelys olivacea]
MTEQNISRNINNAGSKRGMGLVHFLLGLVRTKSQSSALTINRESGVRAPLNSPDGRWNLFPEVPSKNPEGRAGRKSPRNTPTHGMAEAQKERARSAATSPKAKASPPSPDSTKAQ